MDQGSNLYKTQQTLPVLCRNRSLGQESRKSGKLQKWEVCLGLPGITRHFLRASRSLPGGRVGYGGYDTLHYFKTNKQLPTFARFLMTINNDTSDRLVNGATAIIQRIEYGTRGDTQARAPCILWTEFDDLIVGTEKCANYKARYLRDNTILKTWTPIGLETRRFQKWKGVSCYRIVRKQFSFIVAEGLTNHKSQGDTTMAYYIHGLLSARN